MENGIESILDEIMINQNNIGCILSNNQGLCLGARGKASSEASGLIVAVAEQASKLHPNSNPPIVVLESADKQCYIHKFGITGAIYKKK